MKCKHLTVVVEIYTYIVVSTVSIKLSWLFKEIIAVYSENHMKPINTLCGQKAELLNDNAVGAYSYRCALEDLKYCFGFFNMLRVSNNLCSRIDFIPINL
jgi:hypothetical protein